jgi:hypothetical protein
MTSTSGTGPPPGLSTSAQQNGRQVEVAEHGQVMAVADVEPTDDRGVIRASLHAQAGHLPAGTRTRLVDGVLDLPRTKDSARLEATIPLGDAESLDRLRERCDDVHTRSAGASCLIDAALPADTGAAETAPASRVDGPESSDRSAGVRSVGGSHGREV